MDIKKTIKKTIAIVLIVIVAIAVTYFTTSQLQAEEHAEELASLTEEFSTIVVDIINETNEAIIATKISELKTNLRVLGIAETNAEEISKFAWGQGGLNTSVGGSREEYIRVANELADDFRDKDGVVQLGSFTNFSDEIHKKVSAMLEVVEAIKK